MDAKNGNPNSVHYARLIISSMKCQKKLIDRDQEKMISLYDVLA